MQFFFFNDTATTEIYTLSLHDALPICDDPVPLRGIGGGDESIVVDVHRRLECLAPLAPILVHCTTSIVSLDRKSTRLNSSHANISYAVFCLKKKKTNYVRNTHEALTRL